MEKKILVLSDTHIRDQKKLDLLYVILEKFALPVDMIIHAGDAVSYEVHKFLEQLAPLKAVYGNMDDERIREELSPIESFSINGNHIALAHGHHHIRYGVDPWLRFEESFSGTDLVIFGHTHKPFNQVVGNIRYFNPGSATDKRTNPYFSLGILRINDRVDSRTDSRTRDDQVGNPASSPTVPTSTPASSAASPSIFSEIVYFDKDLKRCCRT